MSSSASGPHRALILFGLPSFCPPRHILQLPVQSQHTTFQTENLAQSNHPDTHREGFNYKGGREIKFKSKEAGKNEIKNKNKSTHRK